MNAYNRLANGGLASSHSPPSSPCRSPRFRHSRGKARGALGLGPPLKLQNVIHRLVYLLFSVVYRRHGVLLFVPLVYICGMLFYMGSLPFEGPVVANRPPPGSTYRSPEVFKKLWPSMQADDNASNAV
ncbi:hypothetical protein AMTR_s00134p00089540 [Amborella trichopoda]|uniref:Uncharacterized protein n=1 Tax=Amborella trichopoda TaxID=13333 RepID=W1P5U1_AMBTC|nr:hypothetical protein AMTR_s00134p00089540 [Amborella trichopoda]